jgi:hypothetical protein
VKLPRVLASTSCLLGYGKGGRAAKPASGPNPVALMRSDLYSIQEVFERAA